MPFVMVYLPDRTYTPGLHKPRRELVQKTSELMGCDKSQVRVFFFKDALRDSVQSDEGSSTLLIMLETGMIDEKTAEEEVQKLLAALIEVIWQLFGGRYDVEAVVNSWRSGWSRKHNRRVAKR